MELLNQVVKGISDSLSCTQDSKASDSGFHSKNLLDSGFYDQKFPKFRDPDSLTGSSLALSVSISRGILF